MVELEGRRFSYATTLEGREVLVELPDAPDWCTLKPGQVYASTCEYGPVSSCGPLAEGVKLHDGRKGQLLKDVTSYLEAEKRSQNRLLGLAVCEAARQGKMDVAANLAALRAE